MTVLDNSERGHTFSVPCSKSIQWSTSTHGDLTGLTSLSLVVLRLSEVESKAMPSEERSW